MATKIQPMAKIRQWVKETGRVIKKKGTRFVLVTHGNRSKPMERPAFRRAVSKMME